MGLVPFFIKGGKMAIEKKNPIIFIVSGKANSGKDTSCELINNYVKLKSLKSVNLQFSKVKIAVINLVVLAGYAFS